MASDFDNPDYSKIFFSLSRHRFDDLLALERKDDLLRVLPCLCRMTLYPTDLDAVLSSEDRNNLRALLLEFPRTNELVTFMGADFAVLESDLRKETKLRKKTLQASPNDSLASLFAAPSPAGIGRRFEMGDPAEKFRLLLSELLTVQLFLSEIKSKQQNQATTSKGRPATNGGLVKTLRRFEPLDNKAYVGDCADLLIVFLAERPGMISVEELCEILSYYRNGPEVIRAIVLNFPDTLSKVCSRLIDEADFDFTISITQSPVAMKRMEAVKTLCNLDKMSAAALVTHCLDKRKYRLALSLALLYLPPDAVAPLVSGALAQSEDHRSSLISFIQAIQKDWPVLRDISLPKSVKRSTAPRSDSSRTPTSAPERNATADMDEAIFDIIARDSDSVADLRRIRELWERDVNVAAASGQSASNRGPRDVSPGALGKALREAAQRPSAALVALRRVLRSNRGVQTNYIDALTESLPALLEAEVPLHVIQLAHRLWSKIEILSPRKLYVLTAAALLPPPILTYNRTPWHSRTSHLELCKDPLTILRCDDRVFRCVPILEMILRVLRCYLAASRLHLQSELTTATSTVNSVRRLATAASPANSQAAEAEREELMRSLVGAQESAAVQILLEVCLPLPSEAGELSNVTALREIRCVICSFIHQLFISDPLLSKLVHFQTYPPELLPIAVAGIPSMHICLDFIPEMLSQPVQSKRIFAINLLSCLCEHYAIPKAFGMARLAINVLSTLIGVATSEEVVSVFSGLLPALLRINRIFPPLSSDISSILIQVSRICRSRLAVNEGTYPVFSAGQPWPNLQLRSNSKEAILLNEINDAFRTTSSDYARDKILTASENQALVVSYNWWTRLIIGCRLTVNLISKIRAMSWISDDKPSHFQRHSSCSNRSTMEFECKTCMEEDNISVRVRDPEAMRKHVAIRHCPDDYRTFHCDHCRHNFYDMPHFMKHLELAVDCQPISLKAQPLDANKQKFFDALIKQWPFEPISATPPTPAVSLTSAPKTLQSVKEEASVDVNNICVALEDDDDVSNVENNAQPERPSSTIQQADTTPARQFVNRPAGPGKKVPAKKAVPAAKGKRGRQPSPGVATVPSPAVRETRSAKRQSSFTEEPKKATNVNKEAAHDQLNVSRERACKKSLMKYRESSDADDDDDDDSDDDSEIAAPNKSGKKHLALCQLCIELKNNRPPMLTEREREAHAIMHLKLAPSFATLSDEEIRRRPEFTKQFGMCFVEGFYENAKREEFGDENSPMDTSDL